MIRRVKEDEVNAPRFSVDELLEARPRRRWGQEAWVGLFVILGVVAGLYALFTLTDAADFRGRDVLVTTVADAGGLRTGDPVQMRGVTIGRVDDFRMTPDGVELRLELEGDYPVPSDSRVGLRANGLLGGRIVDIVPGSANERLRDGDRLTGPGAVAAGMSIDGLGRQAGDVLGRTQALLSEQNVAALGESARGLNELVDELTTLTRVQSAELAALTGSLRRSAAGLEGAAAGPELERTVARMDRLTASLDRSALALEGATASLAVVLARIEQGEGTLGRLSEDPALYDNLNRASVELGTLLEDVRRDPKRYVDLSVF